MKATVYRGIGDKHELIPFEAGKTVAECFDFDLSNAVILKNGLIANKDDILAEGDVLLIRDIPLAPFAILIGVIALPFVVYGAVEVGKLVNDIQKAKQMQADAEKLSKSLKDEVKNIPYLRGAQNQIALGQTQPLILGEHLFTPYLATGTFSKIEGATGKDQYFYMVLQAGFAKTVIKELSCDDVVLKKWDTDDPQQGVYNFDSGIFYDNKNRIEVVQDGSPFSTPEFNKVIHTETPSTRIDKADSENYPVDGYVFTLPENTMAVELCIMFNGLIKYSSDGAKLKRLVKIYPEYKIGNGAWTRFTFDQNGTASNDFFYMSLEQMRFVARKEFNFNEVKNVDEPILVRLLCDTARYEGSARDDVTLLWIQSEKYDKEKSVSNFIPEEIVGSTERAISNLVGLKIKVTESNQEKLNKVNAILQSAAKTWNGSSWSADKESTRNPASLLLEVLTSDTHKASQIKEAEIDLDSFGELYEYCEEKDFKFDIVLTEGQTKQDVCEMILQSCNAMLYKSITGLMTVAIDKPKENAIALFNSQNILSIDNKKNIARKADGIKINYISRAGGYVNSSYLVMRDGQARTADSVLIELNTQGMTEYEHIVKYARKLLASELLQPKKTIIEVGKEGIYYTPLSKVLLQHDSLKVGKGNAEVKNLIVDDYNVVGLKLYEPVEYDENETNGMIIVGAKNGVHTFYSLRYTALERFTDTVELVEPIPLSASNRPQQGDILSYGLIEGDFAEITTEMLIIGSEPTDEGHRLTLVDYNEAVYETGAIPAYEPSFTTSTNFEATKPVLDGTPPPPTMDELQEIKNQSQVVILELSTPSVTRGRQNILDPDRITASARKRGGDFEGLFVLEATHDYLHWQTVAESSEPESSREFNLPVTITVDDEQHFAVSFRVSVREALETIIDDETVYSTGDLFAQKDIAVILNADARPIYWGARNTYPVGNLQVGDFYFDTNTQELDGGVLRVWTGSAWVLFNPNDSTYTNAFNIAVTDIMVWVREHGVENFVAVNAIFESIGASKAFITVLEAHDLHLTGTFRGGRTQVKDAIVSIQESLGVVDSSFHGTGKNDLTVVEESGEKGFVEVKVLDAEEGDATDFGGVIFKDDGINKEVHSDRLQEQDWNVAKAWAEQTRSGKAWRLPTRAELSLINPAGAFWTSEISGDEVYLWEGGNSNLVSKQGLVDMTNFFSSSRYRYTSQLVDTKIYIPEDYGTGLEIIDTTNNTVTTIASFFNANRYRRTSVTVGTKIYIPQDNGTALEIIDTTSNTVTTIANFFNASRYRNTSQLVDTKIYIPQYVGTALEIIDTTNNTVTTIATFFNASRLRRTSQLVDTKIYIPQDNGTALEIIDTTNNTVTTIGNFFNTSRNRYTSVVVDTKIYIPQDSGTALEIIDTTNNTVTTIANFFNASRSRLTNHLVGTKIYIPDGNGTALEIIDTTNNTVTTYANFFNASRWRYTIQLVGTKIYIPQHRDTGLEIIHTANTLPVRNNTETQRKQISSSTNGTSWTNRSTSLITAGQTFTSYFGLKLRFAGDGHKVNDYWRYEQDEMGAFSLQDSSGEEYVRAMNGQLHVKTLVGELAKPKFVGKIKTEKAMNKVIFYDENDEVVNPVNAIAGIEIGDVVWIKYAGYDKLHTVELLEAGYMIVNYEHSDTRGKGSLMLENKTNVSATVELLTKWYNAPLGVGQAWVDVTSSRNINTVYTYLNNRKMNVAIVNYGTENIVYTIDGEALSYSTTQNSYNKCLFATCFNYAFNVKNGYFKSLELR